MAFSPKLTSVHPAPLFLEEGISIIVEITPTPANESKEAFPYLRVKAEAAASEFYGRIFLLKHYLDRIHGSSTEPILDSRISAVRQS
ncbi:MAG: hypothetical protein AB7P69_17210 [Candidatus Binatia bacterium]